MGLLLVAMAGQALAQPSPQAGSIYTCVDARGRRLTSDRPIVECLDREQRELGAGGTTVRRTIGPTQTEAERAAAEQQRQREAEARLRIEEEARRTQVLLERYPTQTTHDAERRAALRPLDDTIAVASERLDELEKQRAAIAAELESYKKDPAKTPPALKRQAANNSDMIASQKRFIAEQNEEKRRINARFDAELAKLRQLWGVQQQSGAMGR
jgi:chromosome segregation ATPase